MKKIIYLGYVISPEEASNMLGASIAGNKMQWNIIKNLSDKENVEIECVTVTPLAVYPHDKKIWQKYEKKQLVSKTISHKISYCNLPFIKQFWQIINVYRMAKKIMKRIDADILLCFNLFPQIGIPMRWLKRKFPQLDVVCILADLPIDDNTKRKGLSVLFRSILEKSTWKSMNLCERYIVLNKHVIEKYLPNKPYIVVEGGVDISDIERYKMPVRKSKEYNILFCGALTEYNGILNLLKAMELLKNDQVYLDIYGGGYLEDVVKNATMKNSNIRYYGKVSNQEVMEKQREAWVLINPRIVNDPIAQVTFPSKTFEYLLSGTPVLTTHLNGYGEEYDDVMIYISGDSPKQIAEAIQYTFNCSENELQQIANRAKKLVVEHKNWTVQSEKILSFLEEN